MGWATFQLPLDLLRMKPVCVCPGATEAHTSSRKPLRMVHMWSCLCFGPLQSWKGTGLDPSLASFSQEVQKLQST